MTLTQLHYFLQVAENGSLTRTAEINHVSQPAVSSAIRDLETEFSLTLFFRAKRKMSLTPEGKVFHEKASGLYKHYQSFTSEMLAYSPDNLKWSLAMSYNISAIYMSQLCKYIASKRPEIHLDVQEMLVSEMFSSVNNGTIDVACLSHIITGSESEDLIFKEVAKLKLNFCAHEDLFNSMEGTINITSLENIPLVLYRQGTTQNALIRKLYSRNNVSINVVGEVNQSQTMREMTLNGYAGSFLPLTFFRFNPEIKCYDVTGLPSFPIYLIWKKGNARAEELVKVANRFFKDFRSSSD